MAGKNIVVCADGTGNTAIKGRGTNVFKVYEAIDTGGHGRDPKLTEQVAIYDDGVGTERLKIFRLIGGAFGLGLAGKVRHLYAEVCRHYQPGDNLYFFGFSRGAFTVRTLAGMIADCGIVKRGEWKTDGELAKKAKEAYNVRRKGKPALLSFLVQRLVTGLHPGAVDQFRMENAYPDDEVNLRFVGVWDTVDAVGFPVMGVAWLWNRLIYRYKFPNRRLSPRVKAAAHALSIDDARKTFSPLLWDLDDDPEPERIDQVWFAGVHANVGGGYPKQGMSMTALDWMMAKAEANALRFDGPTRDDYRRLQNVTDKLYDSRAGLKAYYRYLPRDIGTICANSKVRVKVHISAIRRMRSGFDSYAPGNLPETLEVVSTEPKKGDPPARGEGADDLGALSEWLRNELDRRDDEFAGTPFWIKVRQWVQYLALAVSGAALLVLGQLVYGAEGPRELITRYIHGGLDELDLLIAGTVVGHVPVIRDGFLGLGPFLVFLALTVGLLAVAYFVGWWARRKTEAVFSGFWLASFEGSGDAPPPDGI